MSGDLIGALAALSSALLFTIAALLFQMVTASVPAAGINLYKGVVAIVLMSLLAPFPSAALQPVVLLALSGLLGITIGDTAYFLALSHLGARRLLLLDTLGPGFTALLAVAVLHESLMPLQWLGIALTLYGVGWVMRERSPRGGEAPDRVSWRGWAFGLASMGCHAAGVILSKMGLESLSSMEGTMIRQLFATLALVVIGLGTGSLRSWVSPLRDRRLLALTTAAALIGTFLGIWMSLLALKYTNASLAATLNATGPLFVLVLARLVLGERVSARAVLGAVIAVAGVCLLLALRA